MIHEYQTPGDLQTVPVQEHAFEAPPIPLSVVPTPPHVVIVGAGFGGLAVAQELGKQPVRVTIIDRRNFHLFQPLLYQVATAGLSPAQIATPIRSILRGAKNTEVRLEEVTGVDAAAHRVILHREDIEGVEGTPNSIAYDYLVLATGSTDTYFGHDEWAKYAPPLKTVVDATRVRRRILMAFEAAEVEPDPEKRSHLLRFVIVGGGPTGVELAGSIAELAHRVLASDFRHIDPSTAEIILIEAGPRLLPGFPEDLSARAESDLERMGVSVLKSTRVQCVDSKGVMLATGLIPAGVVLWAAGVLATPVGRWLGVETDTKGRTKVGEDLTVPGHPEIFVIGDTATLAQDGHPLPGLAAVAMQMGRYVARSILQVEIQKRQGEEPHVRPFHYFDKGMLATIGRRSAVAQIGRVHLKGHLAWFTWAFVHILYLVGFQNRMTVLIDWAWSYFTYQRGARIITPPDKQA
jgi:NADH:ubiquinone reductase (H+-translocating)